MLRTDIPVSSQGRKKGGGGDIDMTASKQSCHELEYPFAENIFNNKKDIKQDTCLYRALCSRVGDDFQSHEPTRALVGSGDDFQSHEPTRA